MVEKKKNEIEYPPRPMEMAPAATSARPAVRMMEDETLAPERPAARAKGTVRPSETPMMMSLTTSPAVKCFSVWGCSSGRPASSSPMLLLILFSAIKSTRRFIFSARRLFSGEDCHKETSWRVAKLKAKGLTIYSQKQAVGIYLVCSIFGFVRFYSTFTRFRKKPIFIINI